MTKKEAREEIWRRVVPSQAGYSNLIARLLDELNHATLTRIARDLAGR